MTERIYRRTFSLRTLLALSIMIIMISQRLPSTHPVSSLDNRDSDSENYKKVWINVSKKLWNTMKKYGKIWIEFFWSETMNWTLAYRYQLMYEMIMSSLWSFCSKFGAHTFSYFSILFQFYTLYEKVWKKVWKINLLRAHSNKSIISWSFL